MNCYCYETDLAFVFCIEDVNNAQTESDVSHMAWVKNGDKFLMAFPLDVFSNPSEKALTGGNFSRLGQAMFTSPNNFDWKKPLTALARTFNENGIEWYIVGSVGDALRGVDIKPFDIDIVVHTKDFFKAKDICYINFPDAVVAPFVKKQDGHPLYPYSFQSPMTYFGRLFLEGAMIDVAGDAVWDMESRREKFGKFTCPVSGYEKFSWNGFDLYVESIQLRYEIEIMRNRKERIRAFEKYMHINPDC